MHGRNCSYCPGKQRCRNRGLRRANVAAGTLLLAALTMAGIAGCTSSPTDQSQTPGVPVARGSGVLCVINGAPPDAPLAAIRANESRITFLLDPGTDEERVVAEGPLVATQSGGLSLRTGVQADWLVMVGPASAALAVAGESSAPMRPCAGTSLSVGLVRIASGSTDMAIRMADGSVVAAGSVPRGGLASFGSR